MIATKRESKLKAKKPEVKEKRLKMFVYGSAGVGKTTACIQFPNAYIIDTEKGTDYYADTIIKSGSAVLQSADFSEIKEQIGYLITEPHDYRTLIIDPATLVYASLQELWSKKFEREAISKNKATNVEMQDWGMRFWGKVKSDWKALQRQLLKVDMNVIITAHQKDVYGSNSSKIGVSFDSMKGDDYFFDNVFRLEKRGKDRFAITEKERSEIGKNKFPEEFVWSYDNFLKFYGEEVLVRKAEPIKMATAEQVARLNELLEVVKIEDDTITKWLTKADVDGFDEFTADQIEKCIAFVNNKLPKEKAE
jgi:GTPase SAR1 family protein